jgi:NifB/MoaA-like Fe-S oxidoreductase
MQDEIRRKTGDIFVRAADEFYIVAGRELPVPEHYGEYEQLEDGIGMMTYFIDNVNTSLKNPPVDSMHLSASVVTGVSPYKYISSICKKIESNIEGLKINVYPIKNNFFGEKITVTGLLTGKDIIEQLSGKDLGQLLLIPSNLLKSGEEILLDDITVDSLEERLGVRIKVCSFDGKDFIHRLCGEEELK